MTTLTFNYGYWEFWAPYDPANGYFGSHSVSFNGEDRLIYIVKEVNEISIKDIYSDWKEWSSVRDNGKYLPAMRSTGGDPIGPGEFTGDVYFLYNNWRIVIDHDCIINGVVYSDDYATPFVRASGVQLVTNKVSALVQTYAPDLSGLSLPTSLENATAVWEYITRTLTSPSGPTSEQIWNYSSRTLTSPSGPTAEQIRQEIDANSTKLTNIETKVDSLSTAQDIAQEVWNYTLRELTTTMTPEDFWNFLLTAPLEPGSAGEKLKQTLTNNNFLALK